MVEYTTRDMLRSIGTKITSFKENYLTPDEDLRDHSD